MTEEQLIQAYLVEKTIEGTRRYLVDGREFADCSDEALTEHFVWTFRDLAANGFSDKLGWAAIADIEYEFGLRRLKVPVHEVAAENAALQEYLQRWRRDGSPDRVAWKRTRAELAELRERLTRPKH